MVIHASSSIRSRAAIKMEVARSRAATTCTLPDVVGNRHAAYPQMGLERMYGVHVSACEASLTVDFKAEGVLRRT